MKIIITIVLLFSTLNIRACDCDNIRGWAESDYVFKGEVLSISRIDSVIIYYEVTFKVDSVFKGKTDSKTVVIIVPCLNVGCCGIEMELKDKFMVYAFFEDMRYNIGKRLNTYECTETHKLP